MKNKIVILLFITILLPGYVKAFQVDVTPLSDMFNVNDTLAFKYKITPNFTGKVEVVYGILCDNLQPLLMRKWIKFKKGESIIGTVQEIKIMENTDLGNCIGVLHIKEPVNYKVIKKLNVKKIEKILINISICSDRECKMRKKIFKTGDDIYISIENLNADTIKIKLWNTSFEKRIRSEKILKLPKLKEGKYILEVIGTTNGLLEFRKNLSIKIIQPFKKEKEINRKVYRSWYKDSTKKKKEVSLVDVIYKVLKNILNFKIII